MYELLFVHVSQVITIIVNLADRRFSSSSIPRVRVFCFKEEGLIMYVSYPPLHKVPPSSPPSPCSLPPPLPPVVCLRCFVCIAVSASRRSADQQHQSEILICSVSQIRPCAAFFSFFFHLAHIKHRAGVGNWQAGVIPGLHVLPTKHQLFLILTN